MLVTRSTVGAGWGAITWRSSCEKPSERPWTAPSSGRSAIGWNEAQPGASVSTATRMNDPRTTAEAPRMTPPPALPRRRRGKLDVTQGGEVLPGRRVQVGPVRPLAGQLRPGLEPGQLLRRAGLEPHPGGPGLEVEAGLRHQPPGDDGVHALRQAQHQALDGAPAQDAHHPSVAVLQLDAVEVQPEAFSHGAPRHSLMT